MAGRGWAIAAAGAALMGAASAHAGSTLYETFGASQTGSEIAALTVNPIGLIRTVGGNNITNVTVGDGSVWYQDGVNIYRANTDLTGATLFHANGLVPSDIAVAGNTLYESFGGQFSEIDAITISPSLSLIGTVGGNNITNITVGDGSVWYQDGLDIYRANLDLSGATLFHTNGLAPSDIAVDGNILYESFGGQFSEIDAITISPSLSLIGTVGGNNITNIAIGDNFLFYQDGVDIYRANLDLSNPTLWHTNGLPPADIALFNPPSPRGVPEPAAWALMILGFGVAGAGLRGRTRPATA